MINGHGDDLYKYGGKVRVNFSSNVYNRVDHSLLNAHLSGMMEVMTSYPEPQPFTLEKRIADITAAQARKDGFSEKNVCVTSGATEAIYLIAQLFSGARSYVVVPAFSEYADACRIYGHNVCEINSLENILEEKYEGMQQEKRRFGYDALVWVCNPNNPTGMVLEKEWLQSIVRRNPNLLFVFDQSYEFFTKRTLMTPLEGVEYGNVVILHSMTKRYAVPGVRLGYMIAPSSLIAEVRKIRMPWSVNAFALETGLFLLDNDISASTNIDSLLAEARELADSIGRIGPKGDSYFRCMETDTHYMLVKIVKRIDYGNGMVSDSAAVLKERLVDKYGLLVRDASNFSGLDAAWFRIAAQTEEENCELIKALEEICM